MPLIGTLRSIWRYPIKSLAPVELPAVLIDEGGIPGDRTRALIVRQGHARLNKPYRGKEHNLLHTTGALERAQSFAAQAGVVVEPQSNQPHYFDCAPISLIVDRWLDEASDLVGYRLEPLRFRPNLFAHAAVEFDAMESDLVGATITIGTVQVVVRQPIVRCVTPTYDLQSGKSDPNILRAITEHRAACLGIYCDVATAGRISVGDQIRRQ